MGVTAGNFPLSSTDPESSESWAGEADGIGAGSLFKTVGLIPGGVEPAAKGEVTEADCGGPLAESDS